MKQIQIEEVKSLNSIERSRVIEAVIKVQKENPFKALSVYMDDNEVLTQSAAHDSVVINELFQPSKWLVEVYA